MPGGMISIIGQVPLAEMDDYQSRLKSMTGGEGSYTLEFSAYDPAPGMCRKSSRESSSTRKRIDQATAFLGCHPKQAPGLVLSNNNSRLTRQRQPPIFSGRCYTGAPQNARTGHLGLMALLMS
ncbi:MAG: hypothetical protein Ct9H300mP14_01640 [Gammaproteobacteria bacterium]|nr:MAG: hypothetical protein Ct9H300mP14_01640 [Gammaproteobacteria bacterium]